LAPQGFAVAFTSFSENGFAVKDGAQRTYQLLGIFTSKFGPPAQVFVAGASLGGLITIKLVEEHPGTFVGALPVCAVAGGTKLHFDYYGNTPLCSTSSIPVPNLPAMRALCRQTPTSRTQS